MKKALLLTTLLLVNIIVWAQGTTSSEPSLIIGSYIQEQKPNFQKFAEPAIMVMDNGVNVTKWYSINYFIDGHQNDADLRVNSRGAEYTSDNTVVEGINEDLTLTTVERLYGEVIIGTIGKVTIRVIATPREKEGNPYQKTLENTYSIIIEPAAPTVSYSPRLHSNITLNSIVSIENNGNGQYNCTFKATSTILPRPKITSENTSGQILDITEYYDISVNMTKKDGTALDEGSNFALTGNGFTGTNAYRLLYGSGSNHLGDVVHYNVQSETEGKALFPKDTLKATYSFKLKEEYIGIYPTIDDQSATAYLAPVYEGVKERVHLELSRDMITESNVTEEDGVYTIHVNKYGGQFNYGNPGKYYTPNPAIITEGGAKPPIFIDIHLGDNKSTGQWGDFKLLYKVIEEAEGEELGTYYDDCMHAHGDNSDSGIVYAGQKTDITLNADHFQVSKPGLVKVAVYAAEPKEGYYSTLGDKYVRKDETVKGDDGTEWYVYSDPIYFYIDIMKNIPILDISPDPSKMIFSAGDKIDMNNRFEISGYKDTSSNGWEGYLKWGGDNGGETVDGIFYDHFAYTFFIGDRTSDRTNNYENATIVINDWPRSSDWEEKGGDQHSYIDWQEIPEGSYLIGQPVMLGDKIKTDQTDPKTRLPIYTTVDQAYLDANADAKLKAGDMEVGITYNSSKGYGAEYEKWSLEFKKPGTYSISYIIRPWNHARWDIGTGQAVTYTYEVIEDPVVTEIQLNHDYDIAFACEDFTEPVATVIVPAYRNMDVTEMYDLSYEVKAIDNSTNEDGSPKYRVSDEDNKDGQWSILKEYSSQWTETGRILRVNKTTGTVIFNEDYTGIEVQVGISATLKSGYTVPYSKPAPVEYTVKIVACDSRAQWEIMNKCKEETACEDGEDPSNEGDNKIPVDIGKFHFLEDGNLYGGTVIRGVPGVDMTIGTKDTDPDLLAEWKVSKNVSEDLKYCCSHEKEHGYHAFVTHLNEPALDDDKLTPLRGTFYAFTPITNGYLTVDANWINIARLVKRNNNTGKAECVETVDKTSLSEKERICEYTFTTPLLTGNTYYVYIENDKLHLHGFSYKPAFVIDETTKNNETLPEAQFFLCGITIGKPSLMNIADNTVSFTLEGADAPLDENNPAATISETGVVTPIHIIDQKLKVTATIKSSAPNLDCLYKTTEFELTIIDIPSYRIGAARTEDEIADYQPTPRDSVRTTNIPTAITMTFGGWMDKDGDNNSYHYNDKTYQDNWTYKSTKGPASRVGSELADDDPTYNKTFDGFDYFIAANNNPVDEENRGVLVKGRNDRYTYASGTEAEKATDFLYSTTYRIPCRGSYLKFEPEESGRVLLYLVQNGSVDFHHGTVDAAGASKIKWRPLYITDETGKPADMVTVEGFGNFVSEMLPTGTDPVNVAWFTQGISRCSQKEERIREVTTDVTDKVTNCDFDWSEFRGTEGDKSELLAAWPEKGQREQVVRLANGGFMLPHKSYVRYAFKVKAGKTYFVFQTGSKFEFGGFSFVPEGYEDNTCKYKKEWKSKDPDKDMWTWEPEENVTTKETSVNLDWKTDIAAFAALTDNENINVTLYDQAGFDGAQKKRTFSKAKWNSICLPFSVSEKQLKRKLGEDYVLVTVDGVNEKGQLQFIRHANQYIEAGRPYLFKPTVTQTELKFENVTIEAGNTVGWTGPTASEAIIDPTRFNVTVDDYIFKGFYSQQPMPKGSVYAAKDGLYMMSTEEGGTIDGYRALFQLQENGLAKAMEFVIDDMLDYNGEGETTGIVYVSDDGMRTMPADVDVYTTGGMKVGKGVKALNSLKKGVYIVNGEKFVVR